MRTDSRHITVPKMIDPLRPNCYKMKTEESSGSVFLETVQEVSAKTFSSVFIDFLLNAL